MPDMKHYVYSARTTKEGLALLKKAKGKMSWDEFIGEAVAEHYGLNLSIISLPPSQFLVEREAKCKARAEKAKADEKAKKAAEKKAAKKTAKEAKEDGEK